MKNTLSNLPISLFLEKQFFPISVLIYLLLDQTTETPVKDSGNDDNEDDDEIYPQSLIAISVLAGAMLLGLGIAKLVDVIHDRQSLRDDASDMSEYTRKVLKARATVLAFKSAIDKDKEDKKRSPEESAKKALRLWSARATRRKRRRSLAEQKESSVKKDGDVADPEVELKGFKPKENDAVFTISPGTLEAGGASGSLLGVTPRDKGLLPQLTVISEQRDSEAMAEKIEETERKSRENTKVAENKKDNEKAKSRENTATDVLKEDTEKPRDKEENGDSLQSSYIGYRGESDDLMIPVSTDEPPRPKTPVSALKHREDSNEDYDFLAGEGNDSDRANHSQSTNRSASQITLERMDTRSSATSEKANPNELAGVHGAGKSSRPGTAKGSVPLSRRPSQPVISTQSPGKSRPSSAAVRPKTPATPRKISSVSPRPKSPEKLGERGKSKSTIKPGLKSGSTLSNSTKL